MFAQAIQGASQIVRTTPLERPERPVASDASIAPRSRRRVRLVAATALIVVAAGVGAVVGAVIGSAGQTPTPPQQVPSLAFNEQTQPAPPTTGNI